MSVQTEFTMTSQEKTHFLDDTFSVQRRLADLRAWREEWESKDAALLKVIDSLDDRDPMQVQRGLQAVSLRTRTRINLVKQPIEIDPVLIKKIGYMTLRRYLVNQFAMLSTESKRLWIQNFLFIMSPDLRALYEKVRRVQSYRSFGQQRNFLLGGPSGMGKTTCLDWLVFHHLPVVESTYNRVPIIKVDAPVGDKAPKRILSPMILECGRTYIRKDTEVELLNKITLLIQKCRVELVIIDEIQHLVKHEMRRRLLEFSNYNRGIPIICASCNPSEFIQGDDEIAGRWNDRFDLERYSGLRLDALLSFIELLLPFTHPSYLADRTLAGQEGGGSAPGPAAFIENNTDGTLRDIMMLIADASIRALDRGEACLSMDLLKEVWQDIQSQRVIDFLSIILQKRASLD